jgi:hypothetical protein
MMRRILAIVLTLALVLSAGVPTVFAAGDPTTIGTSTTNPTDQAWRTTVDVYGNTVYWGSSSRPDLIIPASGEVTDAPLGFLYDVMRAPSSIDSATPGIYGKTIQPVGTHFTQIFNLSKYPGASGGLEGIWYLELRFFEGSGYDATTSQQVIGVDQTRPDRVAGLALYEGPGAAIPITGVTATDRIQVRWTDAEYDSLSGTAYYQVYLDGSPWPSSTTGDTEAGRAWRLPFVPPSLTAEDFPAGTHAVSISAVDRAANEGPKTSVNITVDPDVPVISLTKPVAGAIVNAAPSLEATASDAGGVRYVKFYVDGTLVGTDCTSSYAVTPDLSAFSNGSHSVQAMAEDLYGRQVYSSTVTFTLDKTVPVITGISDAPDPFYPRKHDGYKDESIIRFRLSKPASAKVTIYSRKGTVVRTVTASKAAGDSSMKWDGKNNSGVLVAAGTYYYRITATDVAGNAKSSGKYATRVAYHQLIRVSSGIRVIER